jgi:hypothetical protein
MKLLHEVSPRFVALIPPQRYIQIKDLYSTRHIAQDPWKAGVERVVVHMLGDTETSAAGKGERFLLRPAGEIHEERKQLC